MQKTNDYEDLVKYLRLCLMELRGREEDRVSFPWKSLPHSLLSLWDMRELYAHALFELSALLEMDRDLKEQAPEDYFSSMGREKWRRWIGKMRESCEGADLDMAVAHVDRILEVLEDDPLDARSFFLMFGELRNRIADELKHIKCFYVPSERAKYYGVPALFGKKVEEKFPALGYDIAEAGNCFAAGRYTACVFHLMRVMEVGVQQLGASLGIAITPDRYWHFILEDVNKELRTRNPKLPETKQFAEATAHLFAVKVAWRNEVMHPKATYTDEEAESLLRHVGGFMKHLAALI